MTENQENVATLGEQIMRAVEEQVAAERVAKKDYTGYHLVKPGEDDERADTKIAIEYTEEEIAQMVADGYYLLDYEDSMKLMGNRGGEYLISHVDGSIYPKPPHVPTADELLAQLDAEYEAKFKEIDNQIILAQAKSNDEYLQELLQEEAALKDEYTQKRGEINA